MTNINYHWPEDGHQTSQIAKCFEVITLFKKLSLRPSVLIWNSTRDIKFDEAILKK